MVIKLFSDRKNSFLAKKNLMGTLSKLGICLHRYYILEQSESHLILENIIICDIGTYIIHIARDINDEINKCSLYMNMCVHTKDNGKAHRS